MPQPPRRQAARRRGFTLVEVLIVVVILGILASIVVAQMTTATGDSRQVIFATNLRQFAESARFHHTRSGEWPQDSDTGAVPAELADLIDARVFTVATAVGGAWDYERDEGGVTSAVGVHFDAGQTPPTDLLEAIDGRIDDGSLAAGSFREIAAGRYYWVLED